MTVLLNGRRPYEGVPFIRALPTGRNIVQHIKMPPALDAAANRFLAAGGRYFIAAMSPDWQHVKLTCAMPGPSGELRTIFQTESDNGEGLLAAIGLLVRMSISSLNSQGAH